MKIQNLFNVGIIDKDSQGRFVAEGKLIDAENFFVNTLEGSGGGVGKNALGNALKTAYNITGGHTIGHGVNSSANKVYNLIKGTNHDYIIEYDTETHVSHIVAQSIVNGILNFITGERIVNVDVIVSGEPYDSETKQGGDLLAFSGDSNPPRLLNIERFKANHIAIGIGWFTEEEISVMKPSPIDAPTLGLTSSESGGVENFLNDKFICFAYRYKYNDNLFSAFSPWSEVAFSPDSFKMDYQTYDNKGMLNVFNAVDVSYNTGVRSVLEVQLLMRESNSSKTYIVDKFKKTANNITQTFQFDNSKIYLALPDSQYTRSFDNVPLEARAQTIFGNRLGYADYLEGRNITEDIDFDLEIVSEDVFSDTLASTIEDYVDTTLHSNSIDFESGIPGTGTGHVDYMNFTTNNINFTLSGTERAKINITVTPRETFGSSVYKIVIRDGATLVAEWINLTGIHTVEQILNSAANLTCFVYSDSGLIYDALLVFTKQEKVPFVSTIFQYNYTAISQLSFPNSTGILTSLEGDTIIKTNCITNLSTFVFSSGKNLRFNFTLKSSLNEDNVIDITFPYALTSNYTDLADFIANSSFKAQIEGAFSTSFKAYMSASGTEVSYTGFLVSIPTTGYLKIRTPKVVYNVTEDSGITENKTDFHIIYDYNSTVSAGTSYASLHSNRDLEVCIVYLDGEGRKTTALICPKNTVHIPAEKSINVNKLKISVNHNPPSWAKAYRFGIKQSKKEYDTLYGNLVYKDGLYRWINIVGENKNKVKEGYELILKSDFSGALDRLVKVKVLEAGYKDVNFIEGNNLTTTNELKEKSGYYIKIKQGNFDVNVEKDNFKEFSVFSKRRYPTRDNITTSPEFGSYDATNVFVPYLVGAGTIINFFIEIKAHGAIEFNHSYSREFIANEDYTSIQDWFETEVAGLSEWTTFATSYLLEGHRGVFSTNGETFHIRPWRDGTSSRDIMTTLKFEVAFSKGNLIFETDPILELNTPFYTTPETFRIVDGGHEFTDHTLSRTFDCFCFGNGVESNRIRDAFNEKSFSIDSSPTAVSEVGYKQIRRFADITYSGVYNSNTNINKLNEFNLSLANFKEDIDKSYGPIVKIKGTDSNLEVYQEDKCSKVYYGKDVLYNADGSSNLTKIESVLGQQEMYGGEYGISYHPESFDEYAFNSYLTDTKRGIVLKKSNNGLFEISSQGMNSYFKKLFRDNVIDQIIGEYDQHHDVFVLNIKYNGSQYVTWVYSDKDNGWLGRLPFNPEDMCRVNGKFLAFFNGEIYEHNQSTGRNTFFGVEYPSTFTINFPQEPSSRKNYKTIEIEGTDAWDLTINTDFDAGYVNAVDFNKEEGVFKAHTRLSNTVIDTSLLSVQGIGNCTVAGLVLSFGFDLSSDVSIGDDVRNLDNELVGTILSKTPNSITLNAVANIVSGDFVILSKPQSANVNSLLGYHLQVSGTLTKNTKTELFAVNAEVVRSFN